MMPQQLQFLLDPYRVIEKYASCKINKKSSKIESYQLGSVWTYLDKEHCNLNNAHNMSTRESERANGVGT